MLQCWQESPDERPLFSQLQENLESMMIRDTPYLPVNFRGVDESSVYYNVPSFNSVTEEDEDEVTLNFGGDKESNNAADSGTGSLAEEGHTIEVIEQPEGYSGLAFEALDKFSYWYGHETKSCFFKSCLLKTRFHWVHGVSWLSAATGKETSAQAKQGHGLLWWSSEPDVQTAGAQGPVWRCKLALLAFPIAEL